MTSKIKTTRITRIALFFETISSGTQPLSITSMLSPFLSIPKRCIRVNKRHEWGQGGGDNNLDLKKNKHNNIAYTKH